jgi:hypothetical protein
VARQVVVIPDLRREALRASGVFPGSWGLGGGRGEIDGLPALISSEELRQKLHGNDEDWLAETFLAPNGSVLTTWISFVDEPGGEHGALHAIRVLQRRLRGRLDAVLGYREVEVIDLTVLVDDEIDQGLDDDGPLAARVDRAWRELRMPGPLFYMGPRLNFVDDGSLRTSTAWPIAVGGLILAMHVDDGPRAGLPGDGIHVWRCIAWKPWSHDEAARLRRLLSEQVGEFVQPGRNSQANLRVEGLETNLRDLLAVDGGVEILDPPVSERVDLDFVEPQAVLDRFDATGDFGEYGKAQRRRRHSAESADHQRQFALWSSAWRVAESWPLGARRSRQILEEVPVAGSDGEGAVGDVARLFARVRSGEEALAQERERVEECGGEISLAESGRIGPAWRLIVSVAIVALFSHTIWSVAEGYLGLTGIALQLVAAAAVGSVVASVALSLREITALRAARRFFAEDLVDGLYAARRANVRKRSAIMASATSQRFRDHDRATRSALHHQLSRMGDIVGSAMGLVTGLPEESVSAVGVDDPRLVDCFLPVLFDEAPALRDRERATASIRQALERTEQRWDAFVTSHDPYYRGDLPATPLFELLSAATTELRLQAVQSRFAALGEELPRRLVESASAVDKRHFISGLSHRQEGLCEEPLLWTSLEHYTEGLEDWDCAHESRERLQALGYVGLRLDHIPFASGTQFHGAGGERR